MRHATQFLFGIRKHLERIVALILVVTACMKLMALHEPAHLFELKNPIFYALTNASVYKLAACVEIIVAIILLRGTNSRLKAWLLVWLVSCFSIYRLGLLWVSGGVAECSCLGNGYRWWPWLHDNLAATSKAVFFALVAIVILRVIAQVGETKTTTNK